MSQGQYAEIELGKESTNNLRINLNEHVIMYVYF
ncbi:hypothetical protein SNOG_00376 [Parastagonospora nodorum SN15]|uniref:Uncharacterized protein n=1 Tax=Phaeosphaeria nodorum (strain SN15 / ATCC MYA-4574 / FGSC 10173) TaxID=321614 RepID=Q0V6I8_PHANO|nr:hypothetical protein SNOG_00376 [Parastagonospora nodorum SN15]EAT91871.1 hypothetical protein SNOG_00376 [Parastagonospora nodorum SN15]